MEKKFKVEFTENELKTVLVGLTKLPYEAVANIIQNIQTQVQSQIEIVKEETPIQGESKPEKKKGK